MLSAIPYHTFPDLVKIGGFQLRAFGLMVGLGVLLGAYAAGVYAERFGIEREDTYQMATRLVVFGVIGARISWVLSHLDAIDSPVDIIAVWEGGLQFSGGFIAAVLVAFPTVRKWDRLRRWRMIDGYGMGLSLGLAFGRIGCISVGEHFGSTWGSSWFPLMVRYEGGSVREPTLGTMPLDEGTVFHHTALYELLWLLAIFAILWKVLNRTPPVAPGTGIGLFCAIYAPMRFGSDFLRINDNTVLGLTGAQYLMLAVMVAAVWLLRFVAPRNAALQAAEQEAAAAAEDAETEAAPDAVDAVDAIDTPTPDPEPTDQDPESADH